MNNYGRIIDALVDLIELVEYEGINVNNVEVEDIADMLGIPEMIVNAYFNDPPYEEEEQPF